MAPGPGGLPARASEGHLHQGGPISTTMKHLLGRVAFPQYVYYYLTSVIASIALAMMTAMLFVIRLFTVMMITQRVRQVPNANVNGLHACQISGTQDALRRALGR